MFRAALVPTVTRRGDAVRLAVAEEAFAARFRFIGKARGHHRRGPASPRVAAAPGRCLAYGGDAEPIRGVDA